MKKIVCLAACFSLVVACGDQAVDEFAGSENEVRIMTLNPGHFHAGLIHQHEYHQVDPVVHIYAPGGPELESHLGLIEGFNSRTENPTNWSTEVYRGDDYLERMLADRPGNVMVVAGNNARKIEYLERTIDEGIHILADKPMIIHPDNFDVLVQSLESADRQDILVNDIMTERHAITNILQRELAQFSDLFGEIRQGSPDDPAIVKESVHFYYKTVAGEPLVRPAWFFDVTQQGEAIVDVSIHLVDQILWQLFPDQPIDFRNEEDEVEVVEARTWTTDMTLEQFEKVTHQNSYPEYLEPHVEDGVLMVNDNGEFVFTVRGIHGKVSAQWGYTNPEGGDTHFSVLRGTRADLVIRQDVEQDFQATLYVEPAPDVATEDFETALFDAFEALSGRYEGLSARETDEFGWEILVPDAYIKTHEDHFTQVTEEYLEYLVDRELPEWERINLLTKYFITTQAYALSR